jgi:hypothetical protein
VNEEQFGTIRCFTHVDTPTVDAAELDITLDALRRAAELLDAGFEQRIVDILTGRETGNEIAVEYRDVTPVPLGLPAPRRGGGRGTR